MTWDMVSASVGNAGPTDITAVSVAFNEMLLQTSISSTEWQKWCLASRCCLWSLEALVFECFVRGLVCVSVCWPIMSSCGTI